MATTAATDNAEIACIVTGPDVIKSLSIAGSKLTTDLSSRVSIVWSIYTGWGSITAESDTHLTNLAAPHRPGTVVVQALVTNASTGYFSTCIKPMTVLAASRGGVVLNSDLGDIADNVYGTVFTPSNTLDFAQWRAASFSVSGYFHRAHADSDSSTHPNGPGIECNIWRRDSS